MNTRRMHLFALACLGISLFPAALRAQADTVQQATASPIDTADTARAAADTVKREMSTDLLTPPAPQLDTNWRPRRKNLAAIEADYLARYGTSDSSRALIRYWFARRKSSTTLATVSGIAFGVGTGLVFVGIASTDSYSANSIISKNTGLIILGANLMGLSAPPLFISAVNLGRFSRSKLENVLTGRKQISQRRWRKALGY